MRLVVRLIVLLMQFINKITGKVVNITGEDATIYIV